jgi:hypothetical protein
MENKLQLGLKIMGHISFRKSARALSKCLAIEDAPRNIWEVKEVPGKLGSRESRAIPQSAHRGGALWADVNKDREVKRTQNEW